MLPRMESPTATWYSFASKSGNASPGMITDTVSSVTASGIASVAMIVLSSKKGASSAKSPS